MVVEGVQMATGWDLAGYGNSCSPFCLAQRRSNAITATVIRCRSVCSPGLSMNDDVTSVVDEEQRILEACCRLGPFIVDVPIDLQDLCTIVDRGKSRHVDWYWQLVMRPIDFALNGLKPLADNIGFPVARLANLLSSLPTETLVRLDETLFETYPAASLELLRQTHPALQAVYDKYRFRKALLGTKECNWPSWVKEFLDGQPEVSRKTKELCIATVVRAVSHDTGSNPDGKLNQFRERYEAFRTTLARLDKPPYKGGKVVWAETCWKSAGKAVSDDALADLMNVLRFVGDVGSSPVTADDFDSVLCSLVGVIPECTIPEDQLEAVVQAKAGGECGCSLVPKGYRILKTVQESLRITVAIEECDSCEAVCSYLSKVASAKSMSNADKSEHTLKSVEM